MKLNDLIKELKTNIEEIDSLRELFINGSLNESHFKLVHNSCQHAKTYLKTAEKRLHSNGILLWNKLFPGD